jgi:hypothetical protein
MVFPVVLRGRPGTSARNHPHETSTSKPVVPVVMCLKSSPATARQGVISLFESIVSASRGIQQVWFLSCTFTRLLGNSVSGLG